MKKIITLLLLMTMLFSMASCQKEADISSDNPEEVMETETAEEVGEKEIEEESSAKEETDEIDFITGTAWLSDLDVEMILSFLYRCHKWGFSEYDSQNAVDSWLLSGLTSADPIVVYDRYPVDPELVCFDAENDTQKDPRGKTSKDLNSGGWWGYAKTKKDAVDWVAKNIFNATDEDIKEMLEKGESEDYLYLQDGYYYHVIYPGGGPGNNKIDKVKVDKKGQLYSIEYTYNDSKTCYALLSKKRMNSEQYWSIYYHSTTPPNNINSYGPPSLRFSDGETYKVTAASGVVVRCGPGKQYDQISYNSLTDEEKAQASEDKMAVIKEGGEIECLKMEGDWMKIKSGWICTYYDGEELVK